MLWRTHPHYTIYTHRENDTSIHSNNNCSESEQKPNPMLLQSHKANAQNIFANAYLCDFVVFQITKTEKNGEREKKYLHNITILFTKSIEPILLNSVVANFGVYICGAYRYKWYVFSGIFKLILSRYRYVLCTLPQIYVSPDITNRIILN